ncbi:peptidoglycan DD-metalloendopeptidase family protein [Candidatus Fermentibacteria bacterium]|nr:peptidoglycan DD-metalloendopeptidase family protein [Candidatus Fermentibacteria bacterium]
MKRHGKLLLAILPCLSTFLSSCGNGPSQNEIVIRAEDIPPNYPPDSLRQEFDVSLEDILATVEDPSSVREAYEQVDSTAPAPVPELWHILVMQLNGSLVSSLERAGVDDPEVVAAHCTRCMWWNLDPWSDLIAGDTLWLLYSDSPPERENRVVALKYRPVAGSNARSFSVYSHHKRGDNFPSFFYPDGREVPKMLNSMPIRSFEEITGIFGEPRGEHVHRGVDFKAPEGTPVITTRGGAVSRTDWNLEYNGRCVEVDIGGGYREIFLHLSDLAQGVTPGSSLERGDTVGYVGNTGRSYAPHLHYQIDDSNSGYSIDPHLFHGYHRRSLEGSDLEAFRAFRDSCESCFGGEGE